MPRPHFSSYQTVALRMQFMAKAVLIAFVGGWLACFFPWDDLLSRQGTPLGADFSMFYVGGQIVHDGHAAELYDQVEHQRRLHDLFPGLANDFCLPYRYPPLVAVVCAPLARLPYGLAYAAFLAVSLGAWLLTLRLLAGESKWLRGPHSRPLWWTLAAWPIALETLVGGQASIFAVLIVVGVVALLRDNRRNNNRPTNSRLILAGAVLALAAYKPNVLGLFAVGVVVRFPRLLYGAVPVALSLIGIVYLVGGETLLGEYAALTCRLTGGSWDVETPFWKVHGLASWIGLVIPESGRAIAAVLGLAASIAVGVWWRIRDRNHSTALDQSAAALLVINSLFNPYTPIYDLLLLAPAVVYGLNAVGESCVEDRLVSPWEIQLLFVALFFGPHVSQAMAKAISLQFFPIILAAVAAWYWHRLTSRAQLLAQPRAYA